MSVLKTREDAEYAFKKHSGAAVHRQEPDMADATRFTATIDPQAWVNDYAVSVDPEGPTSWDCTAAVAGHVRPDGTLGKPFTPMGDRYLDNDDLLKGDPNAPQWVRDWDGPFSIYVERAAS